MRQKYSLNTKCQKFKFKTIKKANSKEFYDFLSSNKEEKNMMRGTVWKIEAM